MPATRSPISSAPASRRKPTSSTRTTSFSITVASTTRATPHRSKPAICATHSTRHSAASPSKRRKPEHLVALSSEPKQCVISKYFYSSFVFVVGHLRGHRAEKKIWLRENRTPFGAHASRHRDRHQRTANSDQKTAPGAAARELLGHLLRSMPRRVSRPRQDRQRLPAAVARVRHRFARRRD